MDYNAARKRWSGKSDRLRQLVYSKNWYDKPRYNYLHAVSIWLQHQKSHKPHPVNNIADSEAPISRLMIAEKQLTRAHNKQATPYNNANVLRFVSDKYLSRQARRAEVVPNNANVLRLFNDKHLARQARHEEQTPDNDTEEMETFLETLDVMGKSLKDMHNTEINLDVDEKHRNLIGSHLRTILGNSNPSDTHILIEFRFTDEYGYPHMECRMFNYKNLEFIMNTIAKLGTDEEEDLGYELGSASTFAQITSIKIIDVDQLDEYQRPGYRKRRFFNWLTLENYHLERYQIYHKLEDVDDETCFIHCLRECGVDKSILDSIKFDIEKIDGVTTTAIDHIANKYNLHLRIATVYPEKYVFNDYGPPTYVANRGRSSLRARTHGNKKSKVINLCYFTLVKTDYPEHIIPYDENINMVCKNSKGTNYIKKMNSIQLLRYLHVHESELLRRLTANDLLRIKMANKLKRNEVDFSINETCYRPWCKYNERYNSACELVFTAAGDISRAVVERALSSIPNLYQVSGNVQRLIRKCAIGLGARLLRPQHITVPVVDLDMSSCHASAATQVRFPLGKPKLIDANFNLDVDAAYMLVNIKRIHSHRTFSIIPNLKRGYRYVDLITLKDLIKYHKIEYEIVNGIYYNEGSVSISSIIHQIYEEKKLAHINGDEAKEKEIKSILNRDLYGKCLIKPKYVEKKYFDNEDDAKKYMLTNPNDINLTFKKGKYIAFRTKQWTDSYNIAHWGCLVLSQARHAICERIYTLQTAGVEVLYNNMDSIFIKHSDMHIFNDLFPNSIGNELGQFHYDYDVPGFEYAQEAVFIKPGVYALKLDENNYHYRNVNNVIENVNWNNYLTKLTSVDDSYHQQFST